MTNRKTKQQKYVFKGKVWKYKGPAGWHFVTLPRRLSDTIRRIHGLSEEGWGRLRTNALAKNRHWPTAIWFDSKSMSYLLPIKAPIRKAADIREGDLISVTVWLQEESPILNLLRKVR